MRRTFSQFMNYEGQAKSFVKLVVKNFFQNSRMIHNSHPSLLVSDGQGKVFEIPELEMAGTSLDHCRVPDEAEIIDMPAGSNLFELPGRIPVGYDRRADEFIPLPYYRGKPVFAVAAFMAPAYSQILRSAFQTPQAAPRLPLFAYTAAGWRDDRFCVAAMRVDADIRQDVGQFDENDIANGRLAKLKSFSQNRLVQHLVENCVDKYHCPAAQNFTLDRWECPVPTSPSCNAQCVGCISQQLKSTGVRATQDRLNFVPTVDEIVELTVPHLESAPRAIISFGQGCEGEPLIQWKLIEQSIREIRKRTRRGTININTNASYPKVVERLCHAGLDSIRVSMNSARETFYTKYYVPKNYSFQNVLESMEVMRKHDKWISLNYFIFPGLTDDPAEIEALLAIVHRYRIDYIQMRNLNIDPEWYMDELRLDSSPDKPIGILAWKAKIEKEAPWIRFGYFNPPREDWGR